MKRINLFLASVLVMSSLALDVLPSEAKSYSRSVSTPSRSVSSPVKSAPVPSNTARVNSYTNNNNQRSFGVVDNASTPKSPVKAEYTPTPSKSVVTTKKPSNAIVSSSTYNAPNPTNLPTETRYSNRYDVDGKLYSVRMVVPIGTSNTIYVPDTYYPSTIRSSPVVVYDNNPVVNTIGNVVGGILLLLILAAIFTR